MTQLNQLITRHSTSRRSVSRPSQWPGLRFDVFAIALALFILSSSAEAVDPPPDGGYLNQNTAEGDDALFSLTTGDGNTAIGFDALFSNTIGRQNTADGEFALNSNTSGLFNTATGAVALKSNTTGGSNTATGSGAIELNTTGSNNTATGADALLFNTAGSDNTADGHLALVNNTAGSGNIGLGDSAGSALTTGNDNIEIGNAGVAGESGSIRIGERRTQRNTFIAGISGVTVAGGVGVIIDSKGHLGTVTSSARYKDDIHPMAKKSEEILSLKPVSFRYKHELDPDGIPQFGLVAEQVAKVDPDLVACDDEGKPYTVRYDAVNAMLLNEFLKAHKKTEQQEISISELQSVVTKQQALIGVLASQVKSVNNRLEANERTSRLAVSNQ
jgi:uncharacterized coiled-coil protein SlyX